MLTLTLFTDNSRKSEEVEGGNKGLKHEAKIWGGLARDHRLACSRTNVCRFTEINKQTNFVVPLKLLFSCAGLYDEDLLILKGD